MPADRTKNMTVRWATIKMPAGRTKNMTVRWATIKCLQAGPKT